MDSVSVMSILEQANRGESAIDFSDLPPYDDFLDTSLPLALQPVVANAVDEVDEVDGQEQPEEEFINEAKEEKELADQCGFDDAVDILVVARNTDRIVLALSDGVSQRQLVFCPSSSTGYGLWLISGLSSLVPTTYVDAMRSRLLALDEVFKAQYNVIIEHFVSQRKGIERRVKSKIESRIEGWLEQKGRILLKQSLLGKEGEMPAVVQKTVSEVVDFVWPDVKIELWALYDSVMGHDEDSQWDIVPDSPVSDAPKDPTPSASTKKAPMAWLLNPISIARNACRSFRCFALYTLYPFNRSFGKKIKNGWWWFFKLIRILPFYSMSSLSFLLTLLLIDRNDEFQLISFILEFKGTQFIGVGMISTLTGALRYVKCVNFQPSLQPVDDQNNHTSISHTFSHTCDVSGPGSNNSFYLDFLGFVLQIVLVWVAFFHLPYTKTRYKAEDANFVTAMRDEFEVDNEWQVVDTEERWALVGTGVDSGEEVEDESDQEIAEEAELHGDDDEPKKRVDSANKAEHTEAKVNAEEAADVEEADSTKAVENSEEVDEFLGESKQAEDDGAGGMVPVVSSSSCIPHVEDEKPIDFDQTEKEAPASEQTEDKAPASAEQTEDKAPIDPIDIPCTKPDSEAQATASESMSPVVDTPTKSSAAKSPSSGGNSSLRRRKIVQEKAAPASNAGADCDEAPQPSAISSVSPALSPIISAASSKFSAAYASCASLASSTINFTWAPSDSNRQQLRSFRTYLERLGAQRERGRLLYMLKYDLCVFCLLSTLFVASTARRAWMFWDIPLSDWEWQIRADMYWLKTLYGLLSAPFVVFVLPIFAQVLLHLRPTGYTPDGRCVPQQRRGAAAPQR